jgi:hypothetical protein
MTTAPRHFIASPALAGVGLPHDRRARLAARHAFVVLKTSFLQALTDDGGSMADAAPAPDWLRRQVRAAEEPTDLWLLRAPVFAALSGSGQHQRRLALRSSLERVFPTSELPSAFVP